MPFGIKKSYFKIGYVKTEKRELKFCGVKAVVHVTEIDSGEEQIKIMKSHDSRSRKICQRSADLKDDGPVKKK